MNRHLFTISLGLLIAACGGDHTRPELRTLLDDSQYSLRESVTIATEASPGNPEQATLVTRDPAYSIKIVADDARTDVRVSPSTGQVMTSLAAGSAIFKCGSSIPLVEALAIAEAEAGGDAIQSVPDDDVDCAFEIQVLVGDVLWEVKVAPDGDVLERELSDEFGGSSDD